MEMLQIYTRNLELTERLRDYVEGKVSKFERYLPALENMRVDLSESNARDNTRGMVGTDYDLRSESNTTRRRTRRRHFHRY